MSSSTGLEGSAGVLAFTGGGLEAAGGGGGAAAGVGAGGGGDGSRGGGAGAGGAAGAAGVGLLKFDWGVDTLAGYSVSLKILHIWLLA